MGKRKGDEKMTDLVRATIIVPKDMPKLAYHVMNYIDKRKHFKLIRIKEKLEKLQHINANYLYKDRFICEI